MLISVGLKFFVTVFADDGIGGIVAHPVPVVTPPLHAAVIAAEQLFLAPGLAGDLAAVFAQPELPHGFVDVPTQVVAIAVGLDGVFANAGGLGNLWIALTLIAHPGNLLLLLGGNALTGGPLAAKRRRIAFCSCSGSCLIDHGVCLLSSVAHDSSRGAT